MHMLTDQELSRINHPLGKGEVVSSILTGSTTNARQISVSGNHRAARCTQRHATKREHDVTIRGKSVDFVPWAFCTFYTARTLPPRARGMSPDIRAGRFRRSAVVGPAFVLSGAELGSRASSMTERPDGGHK